MEALLLDSRLFVTNIICPVVNNSELNEQLEYQHLHVVKHFFNSFPKF